MIQEFEFPNLLFLYSKITQNRHLIDYQVPYASRDLNEKYCGDLVQQKTFTPDYLTHGKKYNRGEMEFVTIRDHHEPIISREVFEAT